MADMFIQSDQYCLFPYPKETQLFKTREDAEKTVRKYGLKAVILDSVNQYGRKCFKLIILKGKES